DAALARLAYRLRKPGREAALAGSGGTADEHRAALVEALAFEHAVELAYPRGLALCGSAVGELDRRERQHRKAAFPDEKRILVRAVRRPAVLHHAKPPDGRLLHDAVVEQDDAVRDVFLEPMAGQGALAALGRDDRGHTALLEPLEQPPQLGAHRELVAQRGKQRLERID